MTSKLSKEAISKSLKGFKSRRDDLLHEDANTFNHHLDRFTQFIGGDLLAQQILETIKIESISTKEWWNTSVSSDGKLSFPDDPDEELLLRHKIIEEISKNDSLIFKLGIQLGARKREDHVNLAKTLLIRPFVEEFGDRLAEAANLASPEARELQAVPLIRIPASNQTRIFLSHKTVDKPLVYRYFDALKEIGHEPWLDVSDMPAGSNVERGILDGFEKSCAAVFFITENFSDEKYLATEVDYAVMQKREKDKKFAIITLRYSNAAPVPKPLTPYVYRDIENDLEGLYEIVRALPIELGPMRWKKDVADI